MLSCSPSKHSLDLQGEGDGSITPPPPPPPHPPVTGVLISTKQNTPLNNNSLTATYTIQNNASSDITITAINPVDQMSTDHFKTTSDCLSGSTKILNRSAICTVTVVFSSIDASTPDGNKYNYQFNLIYKESASPVISPKLEGDDSPLPDPLATLTAKPDKIIALNDSDNIMTYTIKNTSTITVTLNSIVPVQDTENHFTTTPATLPSPIILSPQETTIVKVTFSSNQVFDSANHKYFFKMNYNNTLQTSSDVIEGTDGTPPEPSKFLTATVPKGLQSLTSGQSATYTVANISPNKIATFNSSSFLPSDASNFKTNASDCITKRTLSPVGGGR